MYRIFRLVSFSAVFLFGFSIHQAVSGSQEYTDARIYMINGVKIVVAFGDITAQHVDAIVNAANEQMLGGGGIDGAIHKAAIPRFGDSGFDILSNWARMNLPVKKGFLGWLFGKKSSERCPTGSAVASPSYGLERIGVKMIIHTVGPRGNAKNRKKLLEDAYWNAFDVARKGIYINDNGMKEKDKAPIKRMALPQLSVGIFKYPQQEAAQVAVHTIVKFLQQYSGAFTEIRLIMWSGDKQGREGWKLYTELLDHIVG